MKKLPDGILKVMNSQGDLYTVVIDKERTSDNMLVYVDLIPVDSDLEYESTSVDILNETLIDVLENEHYTILDWYKNITGLDW